MTTPSEQFFLALPIPYWATTLEITETGELFISGQIRLVNTPMPRRLRDQLLLPAGLVIPQSMLGKIFILNDDENDDQDSD